MGEGEGGGGVGGGGRGGGGGGGVRCWGTWEIRSACVSVWADSTHTHTQNLYSILKTHSYFANSEMKGLHTYSNTANTSCWCVPSPLSMITWVRLRVMSGHRAGLQVCFCLQPEQALASPVEHSDSRTNSHAN